MDEKSNSQKIQFLQEVVEFLKWRDTIKPKIDFFYHVKGFRFIPDVIRQESVC